MVVITPTASISTCSGDDGRRGGRGREGDHREGGEDGGEGEGAQADR